MRKLIKKYWWGGGLTPPTYAPMYNGSSDFYNSVMNQNFNNIGSSFTDAVQPNLQLQSKLGDMTALGINTISQLSQGLKSPISSKFSGGSDSKKGINPKLQQGVQIAGQLVGAVSDYIPTLDEVHNSNDQTSQDIRSGTTKALLSGAAGPWGMLAGGLLMGFDKTGGFADASKGLGGANDTLNMIASLAIPGAGYFTKKTMKYDVSDTLKQNGASYGGTLDKANTAAQNADAKILFGRGTANNLISSAKYQDYKVQDIMAENEIAQAGASNPLIQNKLQMQNNGGYQQAGTYFGKEGLKIDRDFAQRVIKLSKGRKEKIKKIQEEVRMEEVAEFKNGGAVNVIPDGALHKNKHHLENVDEKFEDVTAKGIPVITEGKGGDITQHAEVEREEIIFNLDVTKQLEKLMEVGSDEAAIEAGKLLVHEILENTVDNTGLLNKID